MDPHGMISQRVYRDGTRYIDGKYVKDLTALNRPLEQTIIIDDNADCISMQVGVLIWVWVEDTALWRRYLQSGPDGGHVGRRGASHRAVFRYTCVVCVYDLTRCLRNLC